MLHRIRRTFGETALRMIPFGLGQTKPKHFRDMALTVWENRDNLGYALEGAEPRRLRRLRARRRRIPRLDHRRRAPVHDAAESAAPEHHAGAGSRPARRRRRACKRLRQRRTARTRPACRTRCCASEARAASAASPGTKPTRRIAARIRGSRPATHRLLSHLARRHQRGLLHGAEGRALPRHQQRRQRRAPLSLAVHRRR